MPKVDIARLDFSYGDRAIAVNLDIHFNAGAITVLMGPSGCGKSTLFKIISGTEKCHDGHVSIDGRPVKEHEAEVAIAFQDYDALPWFSVRKNLALAARHSDADVDAVLSSFSLADSADLYPSELSGGLRKRLSIARCIASNASVFLLDEAFASLDLASRRDAYALAIDGMVGERTAVVLITHDLEEALTIGDRIVVFDGPPLSIVDDFSFDAPRSVDQRIAWLAGAGNEYRSRILQTFFGSDVHRRTPDIEG